MRVVIVRTQDNGHQTIGVFYVINQIGEVMRGKTLEPSWQGNKTNESCIPAGTYQVSTRESPKFGRHFIIDSVPGRTAILFHAGNFREDTQGCILVGNDFSDIDKDGKIDIIGSKFTLNRLIELFPDGFKLDIVGV